MVGDGRQRDKMSVIGGDAAEGLEAIAGGYGAGASYSCVEKRKHRRLAESFCIDQFSLFYTPPGRFRSCHVAVDRVKFVFRR